MHLQLCSLLLVATTALAQTQCPESSIFRVNSLVKNINATTSNLNGTTTNNTTTLPSSFGYIKSYFWYSFHYYAILDPGTDWQLSRAFVSDIYNSTISHLQFPDPNDGHSFGLVLNALCKDYPVDFAQLEGQSSAEVRPGTQGVYYDDAGKIQFKGSDGHEVKWHGCPNRELGGVSGFTRLGYRLQNATVPVDCYDIDLVIEYMDGWNTPTGLPPKCWPQN